MEDGALHARVRAACQVDVRARRREFLFPLPEGVRARLAPLLRDERDMPVLQLFCNVLLVCGPALCLLYTVQPCHAWGALYLVGVYTFFLQRYLVALLHVVEHKKLFTKELDILNDITPLVFAPLFGIPSGMYKLHHTIMHHVEGNKMSCDLSSTEWHQRDNVLHFFWYWSRHAFAALFELPIYALRRGRYPELLRCLVAEATYISIITALWCHNAVATFWAFVLPYFITSFAIMFGNWSQHIFINPDMPYSPYGMTYNCIACDDNMVTFNDGYHIDHHLNSQLHWSQLPLHCQQALSEHGKHEALMFKGIGFFDVGLAVFTGRLDYLADHIMPCGPAMAALQHDELMALLKRRLQPVRRYWPARCVD